MVPVFVLVPLLLGSMRAHGVFLENSVVVRRVDQKSVTLTCGCCSNASVTWRFNGIKVEYASFAHRLRGDGPTLTVTEVETPMLGNYSCWSGEKMVSSTHLMLWVENKIEIDSLLTCRAKSYDCSFECEWLSDEYQAVRLGLGPDCLRGGASCSWFDSLDPYRNGTFRFKLSHNLSASAEESTMLELTARAVQQDFLLQNTKMFYLREIIQPDEPTIVKCQSLEQNLTVTIQPAATWSTPHSFFALEHQIQYEVRDDGKMELSSSNQIPREIRRLRAHSRDPLVHSAWSQWTPWKKVDPLPTASVSLCT